MAAGLPVVQARDVVRVLGRDGWNERNQSGSHKHFSHPTKPGVVTVPMHQGAAIPRGTLRNIIRQAGLSVDEFRRLL